MAHLKLVLFKERERDYFNIVVYEWRESCIF
jgi:hypothetical protein